MDPDKIQSNHCMYVRTGSLDEDELVKYIEDVVADVELEIVSRNSSYVSDCLFEVNMPKSKAENYVAYGGIGHAFVWFTNTEVVNMLSGLQYDGSQIDESNAETSIVDILKGDWSNPVNQCSAYKLLAHPKENIEFTPARAERTRDIEGVLFCMTTLPDSFTNDDMAKIFAPYVTRGNLKVTRTDRNVAYISFDNKTDAYFALMMTKKYYSKKHNLLLSFNYSSRYPPRQKTYRKNVRY